MEKSGFKFSNPKMLNLEFTINRDYNKTKCIGTDIGISINNNISKINEKEAVVELDVEIGEKLREQILIIC